MRLAKNRLTRFTSLGFRPLEIRVAILHSDLESVKTTHVLSVASRWCRNASIAPERPATSMMHEETAVFRSFPLLLRLKNSIGTNPPVSFFWHRIAPWPKAEESTKMNGVFAGSNACRVVKRRNRRCRRLKSRRNFPLFSSHGTFSVPARLVSSVKGFRNSTDRNMNLQRWFTNARNDLSFEIVGSCSGS